jgi:hypothetical protein
MTSPFGARPGALIGAVDRHQALEEEVGLLLDHLGGPAGDGDDLVEVVGVEEPLRQWLRQPAAPQRRL